MEILNLIAAIWVIGFVCYIIGIIVGIFPGGD